MPLGLGTVSLGTASPSLENTWNDALLWVDTDLWED